MKKLIAMFKGLPPELRMMIAMAGLGTPLGAIYLLQRFMFPKTPMIFIILGVAAVVAVICVLAFVLSKIFGRGAKKRTKRMESELASDATSGPAAMDVRAAIKDNNDRYFRAIRDMRKNLGVSIYDLPWYIVIGDAGCGKTKLINESGLIFGAGKPEGYTLGTLNYNWWFTEDAVFIDMAGRLCNPQEESDHREWQAFLGTIGRGRKGFPINGAVVCVSAEHLLQDPPEKIEQDANTTLERLRDLQTKLGVTFATYMVVTKCDKILGFMQFFDRAERDPTVKFQMFGWSKPGDFNELTDPERFDEQFDDIYARLDQLRLRRLNDDADEIELGLAHSYPEEFRELRDPLTTYIRTLFPMIKNPRAIKNLIFRGVYFTSATQQGALILKHLSERLGAQAAEQFPPLENLYPQPKPLFVKDLLVRKVFPEQGLVFRNEKDVIRNRKLSKIFKIGTIALAVLVLSSFTWAVTKFGRLIGEPSVMVTRPAQTDEESEPESPVEQDLASRTKSLENCAELGKHRAALSDNRGVALLLSGGLGSSEPIEDIQTIRVGLFAKAILRPAIEEVENKLRNPDLDQYEGEEKDGAKLFADSLTQYLYLCHYKDLENPPELTEDRLIRLFKIAKEEGPNNEDVIAGVSWKKFEPELAEYVIEANRSEESSLNPATMLNRPAEVVQSAIDDYRLYLRPAAMISANHPDPIISQWIAIREACVEVEAQYPKILALGEEEELPVNTQELDDYRKKFVDRYGAFEVALNGAKWESEPAGRGKKSPRIESLASAVERQRKSWMDKHETWLTSFTKGKEEAYDAGSPSIDLENRDTKTILAAINGFVKRPEGDSEAEDGMDDVLRISLGPGEGHLDLLDPRADPEAPLPKQVQEIPAKFPHILDPQRDEGDDESVIRRLALSEDANTVRDALGGIGPMLQQVVLEEGTRAARRRPEQWFTRILAARDSVRKAIEEAKNEEARPIEFKHQFWREGRDQKLPVQLSEFVKTLATLVPKAKLAGELDAATRCFEDVAKGTWGLAELWEDYGAPAKDCRFFKIAVDGDGRGAEAGRESDRGRARTPPDETERKPDDYDRSGGRGRRPSRPGRDSPPPDRIGPAARAPATAVPNCATNDFMYKAFEEAGKLSNLLSDLRARAGSLYLADPGQDLAKTCIDKLEVAKQAWLDRYFAEWHDAYGKAEIRGLKALAEKKTWDAFKQGLAAEEHIGADLEGALYELLYNLAWADYGWDAGGWEGDWDSLKKSRSKFWQDNESQGGEFWRQARGLYSGRDDPWLLIAKGAGDNWKSFRDKVKGYPQLPEDFTDPTANEGSKRELVEIPWAALPPNLAERLDDLSFVADVQRVVSHARDLMDREVQSRLVAVQDRYGLENEIPFVEGQGLLSTVPPEKFGQFLDEITWAEKVFAELDTKLDGYRDHRQDYYLHCRAWRELLAGGETDRVFQTPLTVTIATDIGYGGSHVGFRWFDAADGGWSKGDDPKGGPQNYFYGEAHICLGLSREEGSSSDGDTGDCTTITLLRKVDDERRQWAWPRGGGKAEFKLAGKGSQTEREYGQLGLDGLGQVGQLSLPAFLHRVGRADDNDRRIWRVAIRWDLPELFKKRKMTRESNMIGNLADATLEDKIAGTKFEFTLSRPVPKPFECLEKLPSK